MSVERTSFSAPRREAELRRIEELYDVAKAAHSDKCAECEAAYQQLKLWRDYEQSLVYQRNAMQSALQSLYAALHDLRGMADKGQEDKTNLGGNA
jgi:flagellar biosynthesis regulator FlaF